MSERETPGLDRLQTALAEGDMEGVRRAFLELDEREQQLARRERGDEASARAPQPAARGRRRGKLGNVIVLPGIMGSELEAVNPAGNAEKVWLSFFNLIRGKIDELELGPDEEPKTPG